MRLWLRLATLALICFAVFCLLPPWVMGQQEEPSITVTPDSGVPGETVTVRGYSFPEEEGFTIYYYLDDTRTKVASGETDEDGYFRVTFKVPESCKGSHEVRVYMGTTLEAGGEFVVKPGLVVDPVEGPVGTTVKVKGMGFAEEEEDIEVRYYVDGERYEVVARDISADENGSWEVSFKVPSSIKGSHRIDAEGDDSGLGDVEDATFSVVPGIAVDRSSGSPGDTITVSGSGFAQNESNIKILFDSIVVATGIKADGNGAWEKTLELPDMPKGRYTVTAEGSKTEKGDIRGVTFEVKAGLRISPGEGHVGITITVSGSGFAAERNVMVKYDAVQVATTVTDPRGNFVVSFPAPASMHGAHQIVAEDAAGNQMTTTFTMESQPPPRPALVSPRNGARVGVVGRITPTLEWSEVSDDSGVTYTVEVAASENFTEPLVLVSGLTEPRYTLSGAQALSNGTYYWRVKAVDRAENDSGWTEAYSFRAGLLPLWGFITAVALLVVLIGLVVYAQVIRRRRYHY